MLVVRSQNCFLNAGAASAEKMNNSPIRTLESVDRTSADQASVELVEAIEPALAAILGDQGNVK